MKATPVLKWLWINLTVFVLFFSLVGLLVALFPEVMLNLFGKWALVAQAFGAKSAEQFSSQPEMFAHILSRNAVTLAIFVLLGLILQAPLAMPFMGAFYALVAFLAPHTLGKPLDPADWLLIIAESFTLILGASVSSGLAADLYGVHTSLKSLVEYWRKSWTKLSWPLAPHWRTVIREWRMTVAASFLALAALSVFVAWFETYGY